MAKVTFICQGCGNISKDIVFKDTEEYNLECIWCSYITEIPSKKTKIMEDD